MIRVRRVLRVSPGRLEDVRDAVARIPRVTPLGPIGPSSLLVAFAGRDHEQIEETIAFVGSELSGILTIDRPVRRTDGASRGSPA